jgi:hypothetical protein
MQGDEESGRYFRYMAEFVGFSDEDARAIRQSALVIEKHLPEITGSYACCTRLISAGGV